MKPPMAIPHSQGSALLYNLEWSPDGYLARAIRGRNRWFFAMNLLLRHTSEHSTTDWDYGNRRLSRNWVLLHNHVFRSNLACQPLVGKSDRSLFGPSCSRWSHKTMKLNSSTVTSILPCTQLIQFPSCNYRVYPPRDDVSRPRMLCRMSPPRKL